MSKIFLGLILTLALGWMVACGEPAPTAAPAAQPTTVPPPTSAPAQPTPAPQPTAAPAQPTTAPAQPTTAPQPTVAPQPTAAEAQGGTLRWAVEGVNELPSIDPPNAGAAQSVAVDNLVFAGLVRLDSDLKIQPDGAESWDEKDGGKTFVFHIRKDLKFANGDPVTAQDFAYSLNRAFGKDFANGNAGYYLSNIVGSTDVTEGKAQTITGVKVIDPQTLEVDLQQPATYFLYQLTFPASFVVPKKAIDADTQNWTDKAYGTGPFMVQEWKHNESITLVPNPNYWLGKPKLDQIVMPFYQDAETALKVYQTGDLEIMGTFDFPSGQIASVQSTPDFNQVNQFFVAYIGFNNARAPFDKVKVKQAFAQAVDKKTLIDKVLEGAFVQADTIIPPGMPGYNASAKVQTFDPANAKKLLADAGFPDGKGFPKLKFSINNENPNYSKIAAALQQMWKQNLNVDVQVNTEELAKFNDDLTATQKDPKAASAFDFYISVWGADYPDPQNFVSQQLRTGVGNNNGNYSNKDFDTLVDQADVEPNLEKRYPLYQQAEQIALDEVGWLPLYYGKANILLSKKVNGLVITPQGIFAKPDWTQVMVSK
jgi:ABC-type transport system substrate-binding protein